MQVTAGMRAGSGCSNGIEGARTASSRVRFDAHEHPDVGVWVLPFPCSTPLLFPVAAEQNRTTRTLERTPALRGKGFARDAGIPGFRLLCRIKSGVAPCQAG